MTTKDRTMVNDYVLRFNKPYLVVEPTPLKNMLLKMGIFPNFRGENKKCLKPPKKKWNRDSHNGL